jgi:hypothetical protein
MLSTLLPRRVHPRKRTCWRPAVTSALAQNRPSMISSVGQYARAAHLRLFPKPFSKKTREPVTV